MSKQVLRLIDHLVLPVPSLALARQRYTQLGFTVAPDARHTFGTENACVNFANGTFLEPLAIGDRKSVDRHRRRGNPFLRVDDAYRFRRGDNGFSKLAFGSPDPKADRKAFKKAGYDTGKPVRVRRPGVDVALAFALDPRAPDIGLFVCERPDGPPQFPIAQTRHNNGAKRISRVVLYEPVPADFQHYLETLTGLDDPHSHAFGLDFTLPNATVSVLNGDGLKAQYGIKNAQENRGLTLVALDIWVGSGDKVQSLLGKHQVPFGRVGPRLVVNPAPGQGAHLAFTDAKSSPT